MSSEDSTSSSSSSSVDSESDGDNHGGACDIPTLVSGAQDLGVLPYQFEPAAPDPPRNTGAVGAPADPHGDRVGTNDW